MATHYLPREWKPVVVCRVVGRKELGRCRGVPTGARKHGEPPAPHMQIARHSRDAVVEKKHDLVVGEVRDGRDGSASEWNGDLGDGPEAAVCTGGSKQSGFVRVRASDTLTHVWYTAIGGRLTRTASPTTEPLFVIGAVWPSQPESVRREG